MTQILNLESDMNLLTDREIEAIDPGKYYNGINFARAIEAAVIKRLSEGVIVEPCEPTCRSDQCSLCGDYYTIDQLQTAIAAARVQALEEAARISYKASSRYEADANIRALIGEMK